jgi:hypothetical protein
VDFIKKIKKTKSPPYIYYDPQVRLYFSMHYFAPLKLQAFFFLPESTIERFPSSTVASPSVSSTSPLKGFHRRSICSSEMLFELRSFWVEGLFNRSFFFLVFVCECLNLKNVQENIISYQFNMINEHRFEINGCWRIMC